MEAEAVAIVVCQSVGVQTGARFRRYIQRFHRDTELLPERLEVVQRRAAVILGGITPEDVTDGSIAAWPSKPRSDNSTLAILQECKK